MVHRAVAKIDAGAKCVTLINVYEVEPSNQDALAQLLSDTTEEVIRKHPGFVSVSIHCSLDGLRVVNYAQWESKVHFDGFMNAAGTQQHLGKFAALATVVSPAMYAVRAVHGA